MESRSITSQGGEAAVLPFGRTRGFKPRVRYNLIFPQEVFIPDKEKDLTAVVLANHKALLLLGVGGVKELRRTQLKRRSVESWSQPGFLLGRVAILHGREKPVEKAL